MKLLNCVSGIRPLDSVIYSQIGTFQMSQNGVPIEEQLKQIPMDSVPVSVPNVVVPQPTVEAPPVSQAQIIVHENSNDLMNTILQQVLSV